MGLRPIRPDRRGGALSRGAGRLYLGQIARPIRQAAKAILNADGSVLREGAFFSAGERSCAAGPA